MFENAIDKSSIIIQDLEKCIGSKIGYIYAFIGSFCFILNGIIIKKLKRIPPFQAIFFRSLFLLCINTALMKHFKIEVYGNKPDINRKLEIRGLVGGITVLTFFYSILLVPLSEGMTLIMTNPIITSIMAKLVLNESFDWIQGITSIFGFIGVMFIIKPEVIFGNYNQENKQYQDYPFREFGIVLCLLNAFLSALVQISIKRLGKLCNTLTITQHNAIFGIAISSVMMLRETVMIITLKEYALLIILGAIGWIGQISLTRANRFEKIGKLATVRYAQVVISMLVDCYILDFMPDGYSVLGGLFVSTSIFALLREKKSEASS